MHTFKLIKRMGIFCAASTLAASSAWAGGFMIPEQGMKGMGMGNAFSAIADDASANWFNPAGLAFQEDNVTASLVFVAPENDYETGGTTYSAAKKVHTIPQAYVRYGLENPNLSFGIGINSPFGLATDWTDSNAPFAQLTAGAKSITFSEIQAVQVNPNLAYQVNENFSVALGVAYYNAFKVNLDSRVVNIGGSGDGFGGNLGLLYKTDNLSVGFNYRSSVKIDITGTAVGQELVGALKGTKSSATTSVTLPDIQTLAVSYKANDDVILSLQLDRVNWTTFDEIKIDFGTSALNGAIGTSTTIPENWEATTTVRVGAEWAYNNKTKLRAGYVSDPTPTNATDFSPRLPGDDRQLLTLGYGRELSDDLTMDLAYAYVWLDDRIIASPTNSNYYGTYKSVVHLLGGGVTYKF
ncbi:MAG: outer membrane protein transport protein [Ghiorsea sp.]